ncbi:hypothetical protein SKAU_G00144170 [Synaphobranchus kaupii]|uniref:Uncharacterized protein n=1 Tax=Synaphobranchus kaupii TaxID=118154 RepID=A0A9Q1J499_SYNKA|nr:hypothetical protein SKAU_G00144170 [Synaphobranchus kaupii]
MTPACTLPRVSLPVAVGDGEKQHPPGEAGELSRHTMRVRGQRFIQETPTGQENNAPVRNSTAQIPLRSR